MASMDIQVNIKQSGLGVFDEIIKKIQAVSKELQQLDINKVLNFEQFTKEINENLKQITGNIDNNVEEIATNIRLFAKAVVKESIAELSNFGNIFEKETNRFFSIMVGAVGAAGIFVITTLQQTKIPIVGYKSLIDAILNRITSYLPNIKKSIFDLGHNLYYVLKTTVALENAGFKLYSIIFYFTNTLKIVVGYTFKIWMGWMATKIAVFSVSQGIFLFQRIFVRTTDTIMTRIKRIIETIDLGINQNSVRAFQYLKIVGSSIAVVVNPLLGIFPLINSSIDIISAKSALFILKLRAGMGSGVNQIKYIIVLGKEILTNAVLLFYQISAGQKALGSIKASVQTFDKSFEKYNDLAKTKFPLSVQIQGIIKIVIEFFKAIIIEIRNVFTIISLQLGISGEKIKEVKGVIIKDITEIEKNAEKSGNNIFEKLQVIANAYRNRLLLPFKFIFSMIQGMFDVVKNIFIALFSPINLILSGLTRVGKGIAGLFSKKQTPTTQNQTLVNIEKEIQFAKTLETVNKQIAKEKQDALIKEIQLGAELNKIKKQNIIIETVKALLQVLKEIAEQIKNITSLSQKISLGSLDKERIKDKKDYLKTIEEEKIKITTLFDTQQNFYKSREGLSAASKKMNQDEIKTEIEKRSKIYETGTEIQKMGNVLIVTQKSLEQTFKTPTGQIIVLRQELSDFQTKLRDVIFSSVSSLANFSNKTKENKSVFSDLRTMVAKVFDNNVIDKFVTNLNFLKKSLIFLLDSFSRLALKGKTFHDILAVFKSGNDIFIKNKADLDFFSQISNPEKIRAVKKGIDQSITEIVKEVNSKAKSLAGSFLPLPEIKSKLDNFKLEFNRVFEKDFFSDKNLKAKISGKKIVTMLVEGMKAGNPEVENLTKMLADLIASFFPQSPAKRGPLMKLPLMGQKIPYYIGQGIEKGKNAVTKGTGIITKAIAKFFPRSLPVVGPLVALISMGYKIPFYIGVGIIKGLNSVRDAAKDIADTIVKEVQKASEIGFMAERMGINVNMFSSLDSALSTMGIQASEATWVFQRMSEMINKTLTKEESEKFERLGFDLQEAKNSGEPLINLILQVAKNLENVDLNSEKAKETFEAFSIMSTSKMVNFFKLGERGVASLMKQGVELGTTYSESFVSISKRIYSLLNTLNRVKDFLVVNLLEEVLPILEKYLNNVLDIIIKNKSSVETLTKTAYQALQQIFEIFKKVINLAWTNTDVLYEILKDIFYSVMNLISNMLQATATLVSNTISILLDNVLKKLNVKIATGSANTVTKLTTEVFEFFKWLNNFSLVDMIPNLIDNIWFYIVSFFVKIGDALINFFKGAVKTVRYWTNIIIFQVTDGIIKGLQDIPGMGYMIQPFEDWKDEAEKIVNELNEDFRKEAAKNKKIELGLDVSETQKKIDKLFGNVREQYLEIQKNKEKQTILDAEKIEKETQNIGASIQQMTEDSTKAWQTFIKDFQESTKKLPTSLKTAVDKLMSIVSPENFLQNKKKIEDNKQEQIKAIEDVTTKKKEANNTEIISRKAIDDFLFQTQLRLNDMFLSENEKKQVQELRALDEKHEKELNDFKKLTTDKAEIAKLETIQQQEYNKVLENQQAESLQNHLSLAATIGQNIEGIFNDVYEATGETLKEFFYAGKAMAMAQAAINTAQAVTKAIAEGGILGIAQAAILSAMGGVQIGKIAAQTFKFAKGGEVPGEGNTDNVSALLTPGEYVIPKSSVNFYGVSIMEAIRQKILPRDFSAKVNNGLPKPYSPPRMAFATGGLVPNAKNEQKQEMNIVNLIDPSLFGQYLSSSSGQNQIINVLSINKNKVKMALS